MKQFSLLLMSIGAAAVASLCCIGPIAAVIIGAGGFAAAQAFEGLRPYFLGLAALALGAGYWMTFAKPREACVDGSCRAVPASRRARVLLFGGTVLVALFAAFPYYSPAVWNWISVRHQDARDLAAAPLPGSRVAFRIEGMTCGGCAAAVESALTGLKGVHQVEVSFENEEAIVDFDRSRLEPLQLVRAIQEAGFRAFPVDSTQ